MKKVKIQLLLPISLAFIIIHILSPNEKIKKIIKDPNLNYNNYTPDSSDLIISRSNYANRLYGFWLGQCIANWTGLVTEMDKIGDIGDIGDVTYDIFSAYEDISNAKCNYLAPNNIKQGQTISNDIILKDLSPMVFLRARVLTI